VEIPDATSGKEKDIDVIYAGRLSEEKGVKALAAAARLLPHLRFSFVGDGPLQSFLEEERKQARNITVHPKCSREELHRLVARARVACAPSLCEESFSLFSVESIIQGLNLVVANNDSMAWLTRPPFTGIPAEVRAPRALASALEVALAKAQSAPLQEIRQYFSPEKYKKTLATILRDKFGSEASA
jgi:glycosyltransferase involved in cell wall biosynthesis